MKSTQQNITTGDNISKEIKEMFNKLQINDYETTRLFNTKCKI